MNAAGRGGLWLGLLLGAFACRSEVQGPRPVRVGPGGWDAAWALAHRGRVLDLRRRFRAGDLDGVYRETGVLTRDHPFWVEVWRLRQDVQLRLGLAGEAWAENEALRDAHPSRPEPIYLRSRLFADLSTKKAFLEGAARSFSGDPWILYGLGWVAAQEGKRTRARSIYRRLRREMPEMPEVELMAYRLAGLVRPAPFLARWKEIRSRTPTGGLWSVLIALGNPGSLEDLLRGLRDAPEVPELRSRLREILFSPASRGLLYHELLQDPSLAERLLRLPIGAWLPPMAMAEGQPEQALRWWRVRAVSADAGADREVLGRPFGPVRRVTRLLAAQGRIREAIRFWKGILPPGLLPRGRNGIAGRLRALLEGPISRREPENPRQAASDLEVLLRAGWVEEALALAGGFRRRWPNSTPLRSLESDAYGFLRFEQALVQLFREAGRGKDSRFGDLDRILDGIRELSRRILGTDVVGRVRRISFPLLGELVDPFGPGLPAYLRRYGRHLLAGSFTGGHRPGLLLGRLLAVSRVEPRPGLPLRGEVREVVLEEKIFAEDRDPFGKSLGLALWNHYLLDLRMIRKTAGFIAGKEWEQDRKRAGRLLKQPFPLVDPLDLNHGGQVHRRIRLLALRETRDPKDRWKLLLAGLRTHELAHLVDSHHLLPLGFNPVPALRLYLDSGLSRRNLMANLEARAECAALAFGPSPRLILAEMASFVAEDAGGRETPHARGYRRILRGILRLWKEDRAPGAYRPDRNLYAQIHLCPPDALRRYARTLLEKETSWKTGD